MKKHLTAALVLCLAAGCALLTLGWRSADASAQEWKDQALAAEQRAETLEEALAAAEAQRQVLESDPVAAFFDPFPYSGGTAGYLASLEADAYRRELDHAAALLKDSSDVFMAAFIDEFTAFIDGQAQAEAEAWKAALLAQGAATAGAWAHPSESQIPIYQFGTHALISACRRKGENYPFLFSAGEVRQELLAAGFPEDFLPT